ncbi:MAG: methyltransferase domain-containing protein [Thermoleophilia bacterium]|nr:methyltransferase domain-containing protein [Thermoleophilia bacterium]
MSSALPPIPVPAATGEAEELKRCCAGIYEHPAVLWLLGGDLHPGGEAGTLRALELGGVRTGDRLLDVASGRGGSALLAARELGCEVVGLDYGSGSVAAAAEAAAAAGLDGRTSFRHGDAEALPFPDRSFDAVLCECSLCTFPDKRRAAAEMRRVLRPGGRLVLADVVADRFRLPGELLGPVAIAACVGDALDRPGYELLLAAAGLDLIAVEGRDDDAAALARRVHDRLRGARLLGLDRLAGAPLTTDAAIALLDAALGAIDEGALGYAIFVAERPPPRSSR